ncbi:MAG: FAD:protein FMN transferase [Caulobacteraceae bacterium]|nr:MAG: FAD:protein FMN transferase [Caulobacteraceae bacterium]
MGVRWTLQACPPAGVSAQALRTAVQAAVNAVVLQMSNWEPGSDISRFNRADPDTWHDLPPEFAAVIDRALYWARESDGAFDPTLGRLTDLWGFGPAGPRSEPPAGQEFDGLWSQSGWTRLQRRGEALLQPGGLDLDLSGIAKGFGVDAVVLALQDLGVRHALVEIGGELRGEGVRPDGQPWWVEIETPPGLAAAEPILVALHGLSLATSGDYRRFRMDAGRRQSHTIDPRTGAPVEATAASVSVLAETCMDADAICTVLSVLGPDAGMAWASARGVAAFWQLRGEPERMTPAFAAMLES